MSSNAVAIARLLPLLDKLTDYIDRMKLAIAFVRQTLHIMLSSKRY